jgi:hypothetical protein
MKRKIAIITVELVAESLEGENKDIAKELAEWFEEEAVSVPWVKNVKDVTIKEE